MITTKTTKEIVDACAWYPDDVTFDQIPNVRWVKVEDIKNIVEEIITHDNMNHKKLYREILKLYDELSQSREDK